jgi:hypothetical protein
MRYVTSIKGRQGQWYAEVEYSDGTRENVPCVHGACWPAGNHYHDPWHKRRDLWSTKKFDEHREMLLTKKRCITSI